MLQRGWSSRVEPVLAGKWLSRTNNMFFMLINWSFVWERELKRATATKIATDRAHTPEFIVFSDWFSQAVSEIRTMKSILRHFKRKLVKIKEFCNSTNTHCNWLDLGFDIADSSEPGALWISIFFIPKRLDFRLSKIVVSQRSAYVVICYVCTCTTWKWSGRGRDSVAWRCGLVGIGKRLMASSLLWPAKCDDDRRNQVALD